MARIISAVMALVVTILLSTSVLAQTLLPLAIRGEIPNPRVLAERVEASLVEDSTGGGEIIGANTTPNGFLQAIQNAGGTVGLVNDLPQYLRSLDERPMPTGTLRLSAAFPSGEVDLVNGVQRTARAGEMGWFDANTGAFILAGDCSNTNIPSEVVARSAAEPFVGVVRERSNPFPQQCPLDESYRWLNVAMYAPEVEEHTCSQQYMLPQDGVLAADDPRAREFLKHDTAFSKNCGQVLRESGETLGSHEHPVEAFLIRPDGMEEVFFEGNLTGDVLSASDARWQAMISPDKHAIRVPNEYTQGIVVFGFPDGNVRTPTASGIGEDVTLFPRGCSVMRFTGIDLP